MQELDAKVAAAIGLKPHDFDYNPDPRDPPCWAYFDDHEAAVVRGKIWKRDGVNWNPFSPSTDLNAAFEAAEKVGLFGVENPGEVVFLSNSAKAGTRGGWKVESGSHEGASFNGPWCSTPAEAICRAILNFEQQT